MPDETGKKEDQRVKNVDEIQETSPYESARTFKAR